jgi:hypothetical protein
VTCPGQDPAVSALVANAVNTTASVTITAASGTTATTSVPIAMSSPSGLPSFAALGTNFARIASTTTSRLGQVQAVAFNCTPSGGNPPHPGTSQSVGSVVAADNGPTTSSAAPGSCFDSVTVGIVQGVGCFTQASTANPLPAKEAQMLCTYQQSCAFIKDQTAPPSFFLAHGGGTAANAAQSPIGELGVDAVYFSTQPVRVDGVEIDPVNGGAVVLARAGLVQSNFWRRDAAYLVSSDAVVKIAGLPVSLHVPDYGATYTQLQGAGNCVQNVVGGNGGCLTSAPIPSVPNLNSLAPTVDGPINLSVSPEDLGVELGEFTVPRNVVPIPLVPSLPLTGTLKVKLTGTNSASVGVHVELPGVLSDGGGHGLTGDTTLTINNTHGLELDFLHVAVPSLAQLGLARLKNLDFTYSRPTDLFDGKATLDLSDVINGVINAELAFEHGDFQHAHMDYTANQGSGYPLFGPTFLTYLGADVTLNPTTVAGAANISIGPALTNDGCGVLGARGTAKLVFADPISLDLQGNTQILCADFGYSENFHADSNGNVGYGVGVNYPIPSFGSVSGNLYGQAYADFQRNVFHFQIDGKVDANFHVSECAQIVGCIGSSFDAGATATFSDIGAGVCAQIAINFPEPVGKKTFAVGAGIDNLRDIIAQSVASGGTLTEAALLQNFRLLTSGCDLSRWRTLTPPAGLARAAQGGAYSFDAPKSDNATAIGIQGRGGRPDVVLTGPRGKLIDTTGAPDGISVIGNALVVRQASTNQLLIEIPSAAAGHWTVVPAPTSAPPATVETAHPLPAPAIRAHVSGKGTRRVLQYRFAPQPGLAVRFVEAVDGGVHPLRVAKRPKGSIAFTPALGSKKTRTILAEVVRNGVPGRSRVVARYSPGVIRPGRASHVKVRGLRKVWRIAFAPGANTTSTLVTVHFADGAQMLFAAKGHKRSLDVPRTVDGASPTAVAVVGLRGSTRARPVIVRARRRRA